MGEALLDRTYQAWVDLSRSAGRCDPSRAARALSRITSGFKRYEIERNLLHDRAQGRGPLHRRSRELGNRCGDRTAGVWQPGDPKARGRLRGRRSWSGYGSHRSGPHSAAKADAMSTALGAKDSSPP
jgi:hypothetical protein